MSSLMEMMEDLRISLNKGNKELGLPLIEQRIFQCCECGTWTTKIEHINNDGSYCMDCTPNKRSMED